MTDPVFFTPDRTVSAGDIVLLTGAELARGAEDLAISGIAPAGQGGPGDLVFVEGAKNRAMLEHVTAAAVLVSPDLAELVPQHAAVLVTAHPQQAFAAVARLLFPQAVRPLPMTAETGLSPAAHIDASAALEDGVIVEAGAVVGPRVEIGSGTVVAPNAVIGAGCRIGRECYIGPGATVQALLAGDRITIMAGARIGQDGFGYVKGQRGLEKMPQIGRVILQDDVEVGSNTTIDRGAMADTVVGEGTKIDNLVQIAHNVRIGRACAIAAHCGISGSVTIGDFVLLGGRAGIADHLTIGNGAQLAAASGVMHDVPAGEKWCGAPAMPIKKFFRQAAALRALAENPRRREGGNG